MKLEISGGIDSLTLIDEHDNTVCTFAVCDEEARQTARKMCQAFNDYDSFVDLRGAVSRILKLLNRACMESDAVNSSPTIGVAVEILNSLHSKP